MKFSLCESGQISFHIWRKPNISQRRKPLFHISRKRNILPKKGERLGDYPLETENERVIFVAESKLRDLAVDFSVKTIRFCDAVKGHSSLVNQLERAATSIGANIHEANYAHGKPDFIAKLQIALKECYETEYWFEVLAKTEIIDKDAAKGLYSQCGTIRRMLIASINTAKKQKS